MKKIILIGLITCLATLSYSQKFSISIGGNLANVSLGSDLEESFTSLGITKNGIIGLSGSFMSSFEIGDMIYLEPELSFVQKGWMLSFDGMDDDLNTIFNFLEISPMLRYAVNDEFSIILGPVVGYALSGKNDVLEVSSNGNTSITSEAIDFEDSGLNQIDYGLNLGISFVINETIDFRTGYSLGFANLDDSDLENNSLKTNGIFLKIGYLFGDY